MLKAWSVGGRHYCNTVNQNVYEKKNPKTNKIVKIIKGNCDFCRRAKSQIFTK